MLLQEGPWGDDWDFARSSSEACRFTLAGFAVFGGGGTRSTATRASTEVGGQADELGVAGHGGGYRAATY